jgi:UDP-N-acetylglucosamine transferase subunit ALG13
MIFLTVGTQLTFDRLVKCVDQFCELNPQVKVIAQIAESNYHPQNFEFYKTLSIPEFSKLFDQAELIISHAGMGSILTALCAAKPILIMPRRTEFDEHRNDHQLGTAENFNKREGCYVFNNLKELIAGYSQATAHTDGEPISPYAPDLMIENLKKIIA